MNFSQQATDRCGVTFSRDDNYPWRVIVLECSQSGDWYAACVFEEQTEALALQAGAECCEPGAWDPCVSAMHYYVGEVA